MQTRLRFIIYLIIMMFSLSCSHLLPLDNEMKKIGPEVQANLVIYFEYGTTEDKIEHCYRNAIYVPRPDGRGDGLRAGFGGYLRLLPSQANGFEGIAVDFRENAPYEQRLAVKQSFELCESVLRVFENIAPKDIKMSDLR